MTTKGDDLLKINIKDVRFTVQIVQTFEYLLGDRLYVLQRYALVVRVDNQLHQIGAQHREPADVRSMPVMRNRRSAVRLYRGARSADRRIAPGFLETKERVSLCVILVLHWHSRLHL